MALKLPNLNKGYDPLSSPTTTIPKPKTVKAKKTGGAPKKTAAPFDPYSGLMLSESDPSTFQKTADTGYASDVARASDLANMGMPTNDSLTAAAAARAKGLGDISAALSAHLAQVQQAGVAQGNQQGTTLGALDAGTQAAGGNIPGATPGGAPAPTAAAQATLAGQSAGTGNYLGTVEAASLQNGAYQQGQAINQGAQDVATNDLNRQKAVASFLSGIASPADRVAGLTSDNEKIAAANAATKLSVWNTLQTQIQQDKLTGSKEQLAADQLKEKKWETQQGLDSKAKIAKLETTAAGARNDATIAGAGERNAATVGGANDRSAAGIAAKKWQAEQTAKTNIAVAKIRSGATIKAADIRALAKGSQFKHVKVSVDVPAYVSTIAGGSPTIKPPQPNKQYTFTMEQWTKFLQQPRGKRNLAILGLPFDPKTGKKATINYDTVSPY